MLRKLVLFVIVVVLSSGCGHSTKLDAGEPRGGPPVGPGTSYRVPDDEDIQVYFRSMNGVNDAASAIRYGKHLAEYLPNQEFIVNGEAPITLSSGIVVGRVEGVLPGRGYALIGDRGGAGPTKEIAFDDPRAMWRIARLRIKVDHWFADTPAPESIDVGAFVAHPAGDPRGSSELRGLSSLGRVIVVLDPTRAYSWDKQVIPIAQGGVLLGDVDDAHEIGFPSLGMESGAFTSQIDVDGLEAVWESDPAPIEITSNMESGVYERK